MRARGRLIVGTLLVILALLGVLVVLALWEVSRSVPALDGHARVPGLTAAVMVSRDSLGTVVVKGADRLDVARGLGFVHAQERFFEMDLARRSAAGELSEMFGPVALERDKKRRLHRMRAMLTARYATMDATDHALLQAYADGVNAGLAQLRAKPWQYMLLRVEPGAWQPVDSLLVVGEMFWMLQGGSVDEAFERVQWHACVDERIAGWLEPHGGNWDGALDRSVVERAPLPGPDVIDLRKAAPTAPRQAAVAQAHEEFMPDFALADRHEPVVGSNSWAVAGRRSVTGDAMLANDMHLGLNAPSIWFRAQFEIGAGASAIRAEGVTLPGVPALVVGSNGQVAWGFTNSYGRWFDWIEVPTDAKPDRLARLDETISVKGGADVVLPITLFDGMPVAESQGARTYALNWVADLPGAYNLKLDRMLTARGIETAASIAAQAGIPQQNILIADSRGGIAWTIAGTRFYDPEQDDQGFDHVVSQRMAKLHVFDGTFRADVPAMPPIIQDPGDGVLWTANARAYKRDVRLLEVDPRSGKALDRVDLPRWAGRDLGLSIGDGGYDLGARAQQIRDRLTAMPKFDEKSLGAIHFDDEALFLRPWAGRIAAVATSPPARPDVKKLLEDWNGRADADQAGYRLVREVRMHVLDALWAAWMPPLVKAGQCPDRKYDWHARFEYAAEDVLDKRPAHLLPRGFASWDAFLLAQVDATVADMTHAGARPLALATWGEANRSRIGHVLSRAVPILSTVLDMPSVPQSGDRNMPHVASPTFGQSERLVVAPGHEERATLAMPGGQSGHPMSPYYGAGHADWVAGRASPLLAGASQHVLTLTP